MLTRSQIVELDVAAAHAEFGSTANAISGNAEQLVGLRRVFQLHGGAIASLNDVTVEDELRCEATFAPGRWLSFVLEGQTHTEVDGIGRCDYKPMSWSIIAQPGTFSTLTHARPDRFRAVHVALSNDWLGLLTTSDDDPLARFLGLHSDNPFFLSGALSANMQFALESLFTAPSRGACDALFVEARVLDLLTFASAQSFEAIPRISARDRRRLLEARDILDQSLSNPPTVVELAVRVGLGTTKLKTGFRLLFGVPVRAYVHARQLEEATRKLESGMSVAEVAYSLGYTPSAFTAAFRRGLGRLPSTVARKHRRLEKRS